MVLESKNGQSMMVLIDSFMITLTRSIDTMITLNDDMVTIRGLQYYPWLQ